MSDSELYTAASRVLSERGFGFRTQDPQAGVVVTEWKDVAWPLNSAHHAWRVLVGDGVVRLSIDCEIFGDPGPFEKNRWAPCGDKRNDEWIADERRLLTDIGAEARRIHEKHASEAK